MANINGKKARKVGGNRFACKRRRDGSTTRSRSRKKFGSLKWSALAGNIAQWQGGSISYEREMHSEELQG